MKTLITEETLLEYATQGQVKSCADALRNQKWSKTTRLKLLEKGVQQSNVELC